MPWIKYVLPTSPTRKVSMLDGNATTAWFDVTRLEGKHTDQNFEDLDVSTGYISSLIEVGM